MSGSPRTARVSRRPPAWLLAAGLGLLAPAALAAPPHLALAPVAVDDEPASARAERLTAALADALRTRGRFEVTRVTDVDDAGVTASEVRGWALRTGADAVVAARLEAGQLWIELRSAHSGGLLGGWAVAPELEPASVAPVVAGMREALGLPAQDGAPTPAVAADEVEAEPLVASLRSDGPIAIKSDQLDVVTSGGRRHLVFRDNVRVEQGDIELQTQKLDAFYREGESQPDKLVASGQVRVVQGKRSARCDTATYLRSEQRIVCSGRAKLVQGCDVVRGGRIEFDLEREHFSVMGAASVLLRRDDADCDAGAGGAS